MTRERSYAMGVLTAWTDSEAKAHGCAGGASVLVDAERDGHLVILRRPERADVFIPCGTGEAEARRLIREACGRHAFYLYNRLGDLLDEMGICKVCGAPSTSGRSCQCENEE